MDCSRSFLCSRRRALRGSRVVTLSREPGSGGRSASPHSTYYVLLFKRLWYQLCLIITFHITGREIPTLNFCNSTNISRNLCNCERHGFCTQDHFHSLVVHCNYFLRYIQSSLVSLIIVFTVFVLVFSIVIYVEF